MHAASFHCGEKISALGRETNNTDKCNVWLCKKGDREVWRTAALDKAEQFTGIVWHSSQLSAQWFQAPYTAGRKAAPDHPSP